MEIKLQNSDKFLIDFAVLKGGLLYPNKNFCSYSSFKKNLNRYHLGIPMLLPKKEKKLVKDIKAKFNLDRSLIQKKIFRINNKNYIPLLNFLKLGNSYSQAIEVKKNYKKKFNSIVKHNENLKNYVKKLKKKGLKVCAFQTRNIPHLGHEEILKYLLKFCDHVVVNPIYGLRKKGDVNNFYLQKSFKFLIKKKFSSKVSFFPVISNMIYAGPREALHHLLIRQNLGFDYFTIGRDHAGAYGQYKPSEAVKFSKKYANKYKIKTIFHSGAYFCERCKKTVIRNKHLKHEKNLLNISGSEFRNKLKKKRIYKHADKQLQLYLFKFKRNFFIK